jgi:hypothetical protein
MRPLAFFVRSCAALLIAAGFSLVMASSAYAQAAPPAAAPAAPPATPPVAWHGGVTFSTSIQAGVTKQTMISLNGTVARVGPKWSTDLLAQKVYGKVRFGAQEQTIADSDTVRFLATRKLTPRTFIAFQPAYSRNSIQKVDYHFEELVGYGVHVVQHARGNLTVTGVGGFVQDDKNLPVADGNSGVVGVLQAADAVLVADARGPVWRWTERVLYLRDVQKSADNRLDFKTTLTGRVKGPVSISISYGIVHEAKVLPGSQQDDQQFTIGVGWQF